MKRYEDIIAWQRAHALVLKVYEVTKKYPLDERYGLTSQLRRAAASVATNIVEGRAKDSAADYARFLNMAEGSLAETDYLLRLSMDIGYLERDEIDTFRTQIDDTARVLHGLKQSARTSAHESHPADLRVGKR